MASSRRLAAILAADVVGCSRLMGVNELAEPKAIRRELSDPKVKEHRGRIVKTTGDGLLIEFGSVVDALGCATEVQAGLAERNAVVPADKRIELRIGINVATSWSRTGTSSAMELMSPPVWKHWPSPVGSASRRACRRTPRANSISTSRISASRRLRISRAQYGPTGSQPVAGVLQRKRRPP